MKKEGKESRVVVHKNDTHNDGPSHEEHLMSQNGEKSGAGAHAHLLWIALFAQFLDQSQRNVFVADLKVRPNLWGKKRVKVRERHIHGEQNRALLCDNACAIEGEERERECVCLWIRVHVHFSGCVRW